MAKLQLSHPFKNVWEWLGYPDEIGSMTTAPEQTACAEDIKAGNPETARLAEDQCSCATMSEFRPESPPRARSSSSRLT
jgi:hypothetical protein